MEKWKFGGNKKDCDELFNLVKRGKKTATCYLAIEGISLEEEVSIVTNFSESEFLKVKTTKKHLCRFCDVTEDFAQKEGEGNLTLKYWKKEHKKFFKKELKEIGKKFNENIILLCEEFKVLC